MSWRPGLGELVEADARRLRPAQRAVKRWRRRTAWTPSWEEVPYPSALGGGNEARHQADLQPVRLAGG
jgi:hypothetical protein